MGRGMLCIDDGVIRHTYFPKPRSKSYVKAFEIEGEDDWLGSFEVGRDEEGNVKYRPVAPSFIDIEDDMERVLAMEAYFNPFKNVIVFKKLVDFLGSLQVQLKNLDWGNEGYGTYKKVDGYGECHARFEIVTPSGRKFNRAFKTKTTTRMLSGKFKIEDVLSTKEATDTPYLLDGYGVLGDELEFDKSKKQKLDEYVEAKKDDQEEAEMKRHIEIVKDDKVATDAIPLATKPPVIDIVREDLGGHSSKLVKAKHENTRPEDDYERVL
ncbi:hypothetical protein Tco_0509112 [Tanacetum coccineum]